MTALYLHRSYAGLYSGNWDLQLHAFDGVDYARRCFMFTGQGSAYPGMFGALYAQALTFRARFDEADTLALAAGLTQPSAYITNADAIPADDLILTRNLAVFTAQVALFDYLQGCGLGVTLLTGSSQGEYAALVCSGAVSFAVLFNTHVARHRICGPANALGYLLAVAAGEEGIAQVLDENHYHLSIRNSPVRTVIAVTGDLLAEVQQRLEGSGIASKILDVPHPYHTPLMREPAERFHAWLLASGLTFAPARIPLFSSVAHDYLPASGMPGNGAADLLTRQLVHTTDFVRQIEAAYACRCFSFLELGPGGALGTFVRKILRKRAHKVLDLAAYLPAQRAREEAGATPLDERQSRIFSALRKVVSRLTGYELESITVEDRFQEDLGIDSLKKVEILVSVENELQGDVAHVLESGGIQRLGDAVRSLSSESVAPVTVTWPERPLGRIDRHRRHWLAAPLPNTSHGPVHAPVVVSLGQLPAALPILQGVQDWGTLILVADGDDMGFALTDAATDGTAFAKLLDVMQCLQDLALTGLDAELDLLLVSSGTESPLCAAVAAFCKAWCKEEPLLGFKHVQFDPMPSRADMLTQLARERADRQHVDVRYTPSGRQVAGLQAMPMPTPSLEPILNNAVVVAFGGAKGITRTLLEHLVFDGAAHLYLAGRSPAAEVETALVLLRARVPAVHYRSLDAQDAQAVAAFLDDVQTRHGRVDFVFNAVGVEDSRLLRHKDREQMRAELSPKVQATLNIMRALAGGRVRRIVNFSSWAACWGNAGQTVYSAGNAVMNALTVAYNTRHAAGAAVALEWPPWDNVGMTAQPAVLARLRELGLTLLEGARAAELFAADLEPGSDPVVQYVDPEDLPLLQLGLMDVRPERAIVGTRTPDGRYRRTLTRVDDDWLQDHMINGICYLPAAAAMVMAACCGSPGMAAGVSVKAFHMQHPVTVGEQGVTLWLETGKASAGLRVQGRTENLNFHCQISGGQAVPVETDAGVHEPVASMLQDPYRRKFLFHGPTFQVLQAICVLESGGLRAGITNSLPSIYGVPHWDQVTRWIDGAFQLLGIGALREREAQAVPVAVGHMLLATASATENVTVHVRVRAVTDDRIAGDAWVTDAGQQVLLKLEAMQLQILPVRSR